MSFTFGVNRQRKKDIAAVGEIILQPAIPMMLPLENGFIQSPSGLVYIVNRFSVISSSFSALVRTSSHPTQQPFDISHIT